MGVRASLGLAVPKREAPAPPSRCFIREGAHPCEPQNTLWSAGVGSRFHRRRFVAFLYTRLCYKVRKAAESHRTPYKFGSGGKSSAVGVHEY